MFGLRPPELTSVFEAPRDYFQLCYIDDAKWSNSESMQNCLSKGFKKCLWIDLLGRQVRIRLNTLDEVKTLVEENLQELRTSDQLRNSMSQFQFCITMNKTIQSMSRVQKAALRV